MPDAITPKIHFPGEVWSPVDGLSFPVWLSGVLVGDRVGETDAFFPPNTKALERETSSVQSTAERYHGTAQFRCVNGVFYASVLLYGDEKNPQ